MTTNNTDARIREARLIVARPEEAFDELRKYADELKGQFWNNDEALEKSLLARRDPLIDLALARYARSVAVLSILYKKACLAPKDQLQERYLRGLKVAIFANDGARLGLSDFPENVIGKEEFARILADDDGDALGALLANPSLDSDFLANLYKNEGIVASLPDERRRGLVQMTASNSRLVTDEGNEHGPDLSHMGIQKAIVTMLATAPVTEYWFIAIRDVLERLDASLVHRPDGPITPILERWAKLPESDNRLTSDGYYTPLSLRDETLCLMAAMYGRYFSHEKGDKYKPVVLGGLEAPDVVLRCAYYGKGDLTEKDMQAGFARDEDAYLLAVLRNDHVFHKRVLRNLLESEQLRGDLRHVYRRRCEQLHKHWPSFDPRPVSDWLIEELPSPSKEVTILERLEAEIARVAQRGNSLQMWIVWGFIIVVALIIYTRH